MVYNRGNIHDLYMLNLLGSRRVGGYGVCQGGRIAVFIHHWVR